MKNFFISNSFTIINQPCTLVSHKPEPLYRPPPATLRPLCEISFGRTVICIQMAALIHSDFSALMNAGLPKEIVVSKLMEAGWSKENAHCFVKSTERRLSHRSSLAALTDAGLPKEIAHNIALLKQHFEDLDRVKKTKSMIRQLGLYLEATKKLYVRWPLNYFWDLEPMISFLVENQEFIDEDWFQNYPGYKKVLFKDLLPEIRHNFDEYVKSRARSAAGYDEFAISQMKKIKAKIIDPLTEMKYSVYGF